MLRAYLPIALIRLFCTSPVLSTSEPGVDESRLGGGQIDTDNLALFKQFAQFLDYQKNASAALSEAGPVSAPQPASVASAIPFYSLAPTAPPRFFEPNPLASRDGLSYTTAPLRGAHTRLTSSLQGGEDQPTSRALRPPPGRELRNRKQHDRGGRSFGYLVRGAFRL